jgi:hypothetical protein
MLDRIAGVRALFAPTNKGPQKESGENRQGPVSDLLPELELDMDDEALLKLAKDYTSAWDGSRKELEWKQQMIESYWLGVQGTTQDLSDTTTRKPTADNLIFEALETFLPKATARNPDPEVAGDGSEMGNVVADLTGKMLSHVASLPHVRLKMCLRDAARHSQIYLLGAIKTGWSETEEDVTAEVVRPQSLILDPEATVKCARYDGSFIGIYCECSASDLVTRFPAKKKEIEAAATDKMGTKMRYIEWWTTGEEPATFWTMGPIVLGKMRNPNFNYPESVTQTDEYGNETQKMQGGRNYFARPQIPVTLLVTTNLGKKPFDITNGLFQCLSMQDVVSKRWKQIDRNADNANNSIVASLDYFEEGQASQAASAMRNGDVMLQPKGKAGEGITRLSGEALPGFVYQNLQDARERILSLYGVSGSLPSGLRSDKTVRGKMMTKSADDDRIGGGFGEYLELFASRVYEQLLQLMYVYYDEPKVASVVGQENAREYFALSASDLQAVSLTVNVKEGSMAPKDMMTRRQEAIDLWGMKAIDPISLFEALDFPNPRDHAKNLLLWQTNPMALFPELQAQMAPQAPGAPPGPPQGQPQAPGGPVEPSTAMPLSPVSPIPK